MVPTLSWSARACALFVAVATISGCTRVLVGTAHPMTPGAQPVPVGDLLIEPDRFPADYPAVVLDSTAVHRALQDIDGVSAASVVTPPECMPVTLAAQHSAAMQGMDSQNASSLIVAVTRPAPPLRARAEQLGSCPSYTAEQGERISTITATVLPPPPVDADDTFAVDQSVTASGSTNRTVTLAAQIGDIRVTATWLHDGTAEATGEAAPDTHALDSVFTAAVLKVRRDGGP
jgi:hypothetical protein